MGSSRWYTDDLLTVQCSVGRGNVEMVGIHHSSGMVRIVRRHVPGYNVLRGDMTVRNMYSLSLELAQTLHCWPPQSSWHQWPQRVSSASDWPDTVSDTDCYLVSGQIGMVTSGDENSAGTSGAQCVHPAAQTMSSTDTEFQRSPLSPVCSAQLRSSWHEVAASQWSGQPVSPPLVKVSQ